MNSIHGLNFLAYLLAMSGADLNAPTAFSSRIDGCVLSLEILP